MIKLYRGDCLEKLEQIAPSSVDMVLTDPPYSSGGLYAGDRKISTKKKYTADEYQGAARFVDFSGDNMDQRSFTAFMRQVLFVCREKTKPEGIGAVFCDWRQLPAMTDALQMAGWIWRGIVVWNKMTARNIPNRFRPDCEFIVWGTNGARKTEYKPGIVAYPGCYSISSVSTAKKHHQTEKPVELLEKLLAIAPPGGTVLDPFMGSGSTGVACVNLGLSFIGVELMQEYYKTAKERIKEARNAKKGV